MSRSGLELSRSQGSQFPYHHRFLDSRVITHRLQESKRIPLSPHRRALYSLGFVAVTSSEQQEWTEIINWFLEPVRVSQHPSLLQYWTEHRDDLLLHNSLQECRQLLEQKLPLPRILPPIVAMGMIRLLGSRQILDFDLTGGERLMASLFCQEEIDYFIGLHPEEAGFTGCQQMKKQMKGDLEKIRLAQVDATLVTIEEPLDLITGHLAPPSHSSPYRHWYRHHLSKILGNFLQNLQPLGYLALHLTDARTKRRLLSSLKNPKLKLKFSGIIYFGESEDLEESEKETIYVWQKKP